MKKNEKIDFVVLWVDPSDPEWQDNRKKYQKQARINELIDDNEERYRDWGLFRYWFRGVEKYAPWVNKVHLVTCGHIPEWINRYHPKLNIVNHSDFMPSDILPTFNTNAIELCLHKIPGLAEQFVLFNDDVFITRRTNPTDFFKNGLPVNTMALFALMPTPAGQGFYKLVANDIELINKNFDFKIAKKKNLRKYISLKQREWLLFTLPLLVYNRFVGFRNYHISNSYLKSTFNEVWKTEPSIIDSTIHNRFRNNEKDISDWIINYWQFASGNFVQRNAHFGASVQINNKKVPKIVREQKYKVLCLNDVSGIDNMEIIKKNVSDSFNQILPEKSSFEK